MILYTEEKKKYVILTLAIMPTRHCIQVLYAVGIQLLLLLLLLPCCHGDIIVKTFPSLEQLNNLAIDSNTGAVYVGGVNSLYRLSGNLNLLSNVSTGPVNDNPDCSPTGSCSSRQLTDTYNKILVLDRSHSRLITCGSTLQGTCETRDMNTLSVQNSYRTLRNYLAANTPGATTVAFIAQGPKARDTLYVAATHTGHAVRERDVPALSSRSLQDGDMFDYEEYDVGSDIGTFLKLKSDVVNNIIDYVSGFSFNNFSYFITVQSQEPTQTSKYITKLVRICQKDRWYYSYVDIPLVCHDTSSSTTYNIAQKGFLTQVGRNVSEHSSLNNGEDVLIVTFAQSTGEANKIPSTRSAVCMFSIKQIMDTINGTYDTCYNGSGNTNAFMYSAGSQDCVKRPLPSPGYKYCGERDDSENNPLVGILPTYSNPLATSPNTRYTAIASTITTDYTVAFVGTAGGHVRKFHVTSNIASIQYADITVEEGKEVLDIQFDSSKDNLYVMTENKITKMKVEDCASYTTCSECLGARDPYCGWCSLERKCSRKSNCTNPEALLRWLSIDFTPNQCIQISKIEPADNIPRSEQKMLTLTVPYLPPGLTYACVFETSTMLETTTATIEGNNKLKCHTPDINNLPGSEQGKDHLTTKLSVKYVHTGTKILDHEFTFYNCDHHKSCGKCAQSRWSCDWCIHRNRCTHNLSAICSSNDVIVQGVNSTTPGSRRGTDFCPQIRPLTTELLLPNGFPSRITLKGDNLQEPKGIGYQCKIYTSTTPVLVNARKLSTDTIQCIDNAYTYPENTETKSVKVEVILDGAKNLDHHVNATLYKCSVLGSNCGKCIGDVNPKYSCSFCDAECKFNQTCQGQQRKTCPTITISKVFPLTSPLDGGTKITITGQDLGSKVEEIEVTIAGEKCDLKKDEYVVSEKIVCFSKRITMSPPKKVPVLGDVVVKIGDVMQTWTEKFRYQDPILTHAVPSLGPKSGGTRVTIYGIMLDTGLEKQARIGTYQCTVNSSSVTSNSTVCITDAAISPQTLDKIEMKFDGTSKTLSQTFKYTEDPVIKGIEPTKSFAAGGRILTVTGRYFSSIQEPKIFIMQNNHQSNPEVCTHVKGASNITSEEKILCPSPEAFPSIQMALNSTRRRRSTSTVHIGFIMDGVGSVKNLTTYFPNVSSTLEYVSNPEYYMFKEEVYIQKGRNLVIEGKNLNLASTVSDVTVMIGQDLCNVTSIGLTQLVCKTPEVQPAGMNGQLPLVVVKVGKLEFKIGRLKYEEMEEAFPDWAFIIIAAVGAILVFIIIAICIICRRKTVRARREYKKMQIQLDTLESNVRNECKQAFAELQTDMSDLTSDLVATGIPYWDYHMYTFKVLFPGSHEHLLHAPNVREKQRAGCEQAMAQFEQLLCNKVFLLNFIRTLEAQKSFTIRDKVNVASLLMIVFINKMDYATDILKCLLEELVSKSVGSKHPKLMLRRTESVVEKMLSNWLSLCLYGYLKNYAGNSLFMLFKSIKHQVEKGPVDCVTSDARYSLSEERLLREKIEPTSLTINVMTEGNDVIACKVLDCDSISQVKEKLLDSMYKNTPFSRRPLASRLDLEWRAGRSGHLTLQDEDVTSEVDSSGWKKVNTLAHYKVPDNAQMALIDSHNNTFLPLNGNIDSTLTSVNSGTPMITDVEAGSKTYHLVKQQDETVPHRERHKVISEIFLTRLLSTKGILQKFVDDIFDNILTVNPLMPHAIKYLFDYLDDAAKRHEITDPEVVYTWKCNSLPLRFWVNIIKNPDFVFDIHKSHIVDSCLSVIAQTFMDSCSTSEHRLGKDSPSNKLLFAKDIPRYKKKVEKFYRDIKEIPSVSDQDMAIAMNELSRAYATKFNKTTVLRELHEYLEKYKMEINEALEENSECTRHKLVFKMQEISSTLQNTSIV